MILMGRAGFKEAKRAGQDPAATMVSSHIETARAGAQWSTLAELLAQGTESLIATDILAVVLFDKLFADLPTD